MTDTIICNYYRKLSKKLSRYIRLKASCVAETRPSMEEQMSRKSGGKTTCRCIHRVPAKALTFRSRTGEWRVSSGSPNLAVMTNFSTVKVRIATPHAHVQHVCDDLEKMLALTRFAMNE